MIKKRNIFISLAIFFFLAIVGAGIIMLTQRVAKLEVLVEARERADPLLPSECPSAEHPCTVSFSRLLSSPQQFHNRLIRLNGFYVASFETSVLYENRDALAVNRKNALWISTASPSNAHLKTVTVVGTFKRGPSGHMFEYVGAIEDAQLFIHPEKE